MYFKNYDILFRKQIWVDILKTKNHFSTKKINYILIDLKFFACLGFERQLLYIYIYFKKQGTLFRKQILVDTLKQKTTFLLKK